MKIKREIDGQICEFELTDDELNDAIRKYNRNDVEDYVKHIMRGRCDYDDSTTRRIQSHIDEITDKYWEYHVDSYYTSGSWTEDIEDAIRDMLKEGKI